MSLVRFCNKPVSSFNEDSFYAPFWPALENALSSQSLPWLPEVDISEDKDHYMIKADLPGLKREDINLSLDNSILTISGERKAETEHNEKNYHRVERSFGHFARSFNLGNKVDSNSIQAQYKDGVLEIVIAKSQETKPKSIDIKVV